MSDIALRCVGCGRKLRSAGMMRSATTVLRRTCRCGAVWSVRIRPLIHTDAAAAHEVQWHLIDPKGAK